MRLLIALAVLSALAGCDVVRGIQEMGPLPAMG